MAAVKEQQKKSEYFTIIKEQIFSNKLSKCNVKNNSLWKSWPWGIL